MGGWEGGGFNDAARVQTRSAQSRPYRQARTFFCAICLSPAPYLCVALIGDVSCLATKQSGAPIVAMTTWQGYHHHGENRDERRKEGRTRRKRERDREIPAIEGCWNRGAHSVRRRRRMTSAWAAAEHAGEFGE